MISIQEKSRLYTQLKNFCFSLTFLYFFLGLIGIINHAMWRDELNPWLIARDSKSIIELFQNIKYEGHPGLWYVCLYILNQFTHNPVAMQITHLIIATGAIYIFLKFSPFSQLQKLLFLFGYFPFYEYLLVSRNYAIGMLLVFAFCALYPTRKQSYLLLSLLLFLLANANAYCLFISVVLGTGLILEYSLSKKLVKSLSVSRNNFICCLVIFFIGIATSLVQLIPPADSTLQGGLSGWKLNFDLYHLAKSIIRIWNSYIVILIPGKSNIELLLFTTLALGLFFFISTLLIRKPVACFIYLLGTIEIILFTYVKFLGSERHYGHLYILLIISLWIASHYHRSNFLLQPLLAEFNLFSKAIKNWLKFVEKYKTTFITIILLTQLIAGIVAFSRDLFIPYSASRETARYIQREQIEKMFMVGSRDATISPLSGYLNRKIYYPESQKLGSFVLFNSQRRDLDHAAVLEQVSSLIKENHTDILLILNKELQASKYDLRISLLTKFTKGFIFNEKYYLYRVKGETVTYPTLPKR